MYSTYNCFLEKLDSTDNKIIQLSQQDPRIAIGILLYITVNADGRIRQSETLLYRHMLENYLNVSEDEFLMFEKLVSETFNQPDTIDSITKIIRRMPEDKRREILTLMQDISLSDKQFHEFEVNLLEKISDMLDLND